MFTASLRRNQENEKFYHGRAATKTRNISRKGAKHVLTEVEGSVKAENSLSDVN